LRPISPEDEGHGIKNFCFLQFFVTVNKCAKYFLNLKRCCPGDGQAQMVLPVLLFRKFEEEGLCTVSYVPVVKGAGRLSVSEVLSAVTPNTCLIRYMCAQ
jgi:hypothetical protein